MSKAQALQQAAECELATARMAAAESHAALQTEKEARARDQRLALEQRSEWEGRMLELQRQVAVAQRERDGAETKERAAVQKEQKWRAEVRELRDRVKELEQQLAQELDARRDEAVGAEEREEWKAIEGKLRAELSAAELERDAYRRQLAETLAKADEPAEQLKRQLQEGAREREKLQAELKRLQGAQKQVTYVERENAKYEELRSDNHKLQAMLADAQSMVRRPPAPPPQIDQTAMPR